MPLDYFSVLSGVLDRLGLMLHCLDHAHHIRSVSASASNASMTVTGCFFLINELTACSSRLLDGHGDVPSLYLDESVSDGLVTQLVNPSSTQPPEGQVDEPKLQLKIVE
jgi:hypothetical protein